MKENLVQAMPNFNEEIRSKLPDIWLVGYMHGFSCESSLQYGDRENSKTYQNFCLKSKVRLPLSLVQKETHNYFQVYFKIHIYDLYYEGTLM